MNTMKRNSPIGGLAYFTPRNEKIDFPSLDSSVDPLTCPKGVLTIGSPLFFVVWTRVVKYRRNRIIDKMIFDDILKQ